MTADEAPSGVPENSVNLDTNDGLVAGIHSRLSQVEDREKLRRRTCYYRRSFKLWLWNEVRCFNCFPQIRGQTSPAKTEAS